MVMTSFWLPFEPLSALSCHLYQLPGAQYTWPVTFLTDRTVYSKLILKERLDMHHSRNILELSAYGKEKSQSLSGKTHQDVTTSNCSHCLGLSDKEIEEKVSGIVKSEYS